MMRNPSRYTRFVSDLLFPLHERLKGHHTVALLREMEQTQWWTPARIADHQAERLRRFMAEAYRNVPYYRHILDACGVGPGDVRSPADLRRLPFLTKTLVRDNMDALKSRRAGPLVRFNTGGSTGEPLIFFMGRERVTHDVAAKWRATRWWGVDIGDREIVVWGSPIETAAQDRLRDFRDRILRTRLLPAFEMSERNLERFVGEIARFRPVMLFGYPSALSRIARHAEERGLRLDDIGIVVAFVTAERLYDHQREAIERVFGCAVANGYGGRDAGFVAHECPRGSLHVTDESVIVEIVGQDGDVLPPGRAGEVVVTHLATADFPFVRYRTGDIGRIGTGACACGRGLTVLEEVQGRSTDFVVAADGTVMHGLALIYVIRDIPSIREFKIVQEDVSRTRVLVVPGSGFAEHVVAHIKAEFRKRLGAGVQVAVERVDAIPSEASGKFRYVVSRVEMPGEGRGRPVSVCNSR